MVMFETGTDEARCEALLTACGSQLMAGADANAERVGCQKAYLLLEEEGLILACYGRKRAEEEGIKFGKQYAKAEYMMIAYTISGPVGQLIIRHMQTDPSAVTVQIETPELPE